MELYKRFLTSFEMTINVLCWGMGVGWRLRRQPTPIPYKEDVIICHSERSEESIIFRQTTMSRNINSSLQNDKLCIIGKIIISLTLKGR